MICICVPSKGRADIFLKKTYNILQHLTKIDWKVFVEPQDYDSYIQAGIPSHQIEKIRLNDRGLGFVLKCMREFCRNNDYSFVWKMDDDIHHLYSSSRVTTKQQQAQACESFCLNTLNELKEEYPALSGVSFPNKLFHSAFDSKVTHQNKSFATTYIVRPEDWFITPKGFNEEPIASAHIFHILKKMTVQTGHIAWDSNLSTYPGGLQLSSPGDARRLGQEKELEWLKVNYPELYSVLETESYVQGDGRIFTVVNKKKLNKRFSRKV